MRRIWAGGREEFDGGEEIKRRETTPASLYIGHGRNIELRHLLLDLERANSYVPKHKDAALEGGGRRR